MNNEIFVDMKINKNIQHKGWNLMSFYDCKVLDVTVKEYQTGKRLTLELEAPHLKKKFFLFSWNDEGIVDIILNSGLEEGDIISCYGELGYYPNSEGKYYEAYKIMPNHHFFEYNLQRQSEGVFKLMRIVKSEKKKKPIELNDLLKQIIG